MKDPITSLKDIVKDPIEFTSMTLPSAALVAVLFSYKEQIHPSLQALPSPLSGNPYGALLFLAITLLVSLLLKRVSHDLLNWTYDVFYRDPKRKRSETWYRRVNMSGDTLIDQYQKTVDELTESKHPVVEKIKLLQIQSKLARSISLILFLLAIALAFKSIFVLAVVCVLLSFYMLYAFYKFRWEASESVYQAKYDTSVGSPA